MLLILIVITTWRAAALEAAQPLRVSLACSANKVTMSDAVTLSVKIENTSEAPVWIFGDLRWGEGGGLILHVGPWADDGPLPLVIDHFRFDESDVTSDALVRLSPSIFVGKERTIDVRDLVRHPGQYRIWVEYRSPISAKAFHRLFWAKERGSVVSQAIILRVDNRR